MKVNFCGAFRSVSGYSEFSRFFVYSMNRHGIDVTAENINLDQSNADFGKKGQLINKLSKKIQADINIVNMIPPLFARYRHQGARNVGFTMWEATSLPPIWTQQCNQMDAIMVPCQWNKEVFQNSGVRVPIYVVSPGVDEDELPTVSEKTDDGEYRFYSIFQWSERKNPVGLLKAYLSTFTDKDPVSLTLKTYSRIPSDQYRHLIEKEIESVRQQLNPTNKNWPKVNLIGTSLSTEQMSQLHRDNNCFVLPHRTEGWGVPHQDAMANGNPVISTGFSGNMEFMNEQNSYLLRYGMTPVSNMSWLVPWMNQSMRWAEPDIGQLADTMRYCFENRAAAREMGLRGRKHIIENFNTKTAAEQMRAALEKIGA